jgi:hypothetical protein
LFLRKLNEFFKHLPAKEDDDLRAEYYFGFKSPGPFLDASEVKQINKGVGHITLKEAREGKKDWTELVKGSVPVAIDRSLEFFRFLRGSDQLSSSKREEAEYYIERLERMKSLLNRQSAEVPATAASHP